LASRRRALELLTLGLGGAVVAAIAVPVLRVLVYPVGRRTVRSGAGAVPVGRSAEVIAGGPPVRLAVIAAEGHDAYRKLAAMPLGAAWVRREVGGQLVALSASCPHLGCAVDFDADVHAFRCPCHKSGFAIDGRREFGPAKRGMDPLEVSEADGRVLVRWQHFKTDSARREPA
jgi:Rieske Fe-S protein